LRTKGLIIVVIATIRDGRGRDHGTAMLRGLEGSGSKPDHAW